MRKLLVSAIVLFILGALFTQCKKVDNFGSHPTAEVITSSYVLPGDSVSRAFAVLNDVMHVSAGSSVTLSVRVTTDADLKQISAKIFGGTTDFSSQGFIRTSLGEQLKNERFTSSTSDELTFEIPAVTEQTSLVLQVTDARGFISGVKFTVELIELSGMTSVVLFSDSATNGDAIAEGEQLAKYYAAVSGISITTANVSSLGSLIDFQYRSDAISGYISFPDLEDSVSTLFKISHTTLDINTVNPVELFEADFGTATSLAISPGKNYVFSSTTGVVGMLYVENSTNGQSSGVVNAVGKIQVKTINNLK